MFPIKFWINLRRRLPPRPTLGFGGAGLDGSLGYVGVVSHHLPLVLPSLRLVIGLSYNLHAAANFLSRIHR